MKKNNILLILTDQHLFSALSCMGNRAIATPNIDRIAEEGLIFDNAYCASPICGPSRSAIFTGRYPHRNGEVHNYVPLKAGTVLFTDLLTQLGYNNGLVGKLHLSPCVKSFGFHWKRSHDSPHGLYEPHEPYASHYMKYLADKQYGGSLDAAMRDAERSEKKPVEDFDFWMGYHTAKDEFHDARWSADEAIQFLSRQDASRPFFLNVSFFGPHHPYLPPQPWDKAYAPDSMQLPESYYEEMAGCPIFQKFRKSDAESNRKTWGEDGFRRLIAAYYGNISMIDHHVGRIISGMKKTNQWDDTTVIFTADHGDNMGNYALLGKGDMYESSARIPLLIKPANSEFRSQHVPAVVNGVDLFGTISELAGFNGWQEYGDESRSLLPLLEKRQMSWDNKTFSIIGAEPNISATLMLRENQYKLIRRNQDCNDPLYELFDLEENQYELRNRFDDPLLRETAASMVRQLDAWLRKQQAG